MDWGLCSRSIAVGGICFMASVATIALVGSAHAQAMQQVDYPQWAAPYLSPGLNLSPGFGAGPNFGSGTSQSVYTTKFGSGVVGIFSRVRDDGAGASGSFNNLFGRFDSPTSLRQAWAADLGGSAWRSSVVGGYKSEPNAALSGLYTTANFGVTNFRTTAPGYSGLTGFSGGNDAAALTANVGVGLQLTPNISVEGSIGFTQMPNSAFR